MLILLRDDGHRHDFHEFNTLYTSRQHKSAAIAATLTYPGCPSARGRKYAGK